MAWEFEIQTINFVFQAQGKFFQRINIYNRWLTNVGNFSWKGWYVILTANAIDFLRKYHIKFDWLELFKVTSYHVVDYDRILVIDRTKMQKVAIL